MKKYFHAIHNKVSFWNLFIGIVIGFGVGVYALNALIPNADQSIRMYRLDRASRESGTMMVHGNMMYGSANTTYMAGGMMGGVTTERQFVEEMIMHHQAAVIMAQRVLTLNPRDEVKKLANDIISAQSAEIKMMQDWLANWK